MASFELFIALRYLLARRKQAFISVISLISVLGVAVGVTALLVALALMTGLQGELRDRLVGSAAHVYVVKVGGVHNPDEEIASLKTIPRVVGAAPVIAGKAMITSATHQQVIDVKGIEPARERTVTELHSSMREGTVESLDRGSDDLPGIIIGTSLAESLSVGVGDRVRLMVPEGTVSPFGMLPRTKTFQIVGLFNLGLFEFDSSYAFIRLDVAQRTFGDLAAIYIELRVDDMYRAQEVVDAITDKFGASYMPQQWGDLNRSLFSALRLEKLAISITIGLIVMVAALNIVASLILLVMEKSRDIAILKTMGSSAASIRRIFMLQGLIIGLVGTAAGAVLGGALIFVLDRYRLIAIPGDVYQVSYIPFKLELGDFVMVVVTAILVCFVATIYPSRQAAKLDPAQALRYQ